MPRMSTMKLTKRVVDGLAVERGDHAGIDASSARLAASFPWERPVGLQRQADAPPVVHFALQGLGPWGPTCQDKQGEAGCQVSRWLYKRGRPRAVRGGRTQVDAYRDGVPKDMMDKPLRVLPTSQQAHQPQQEDGLEGILAA